MTSYATATAASKVFGGLSTESIDILNANKTDLIGKTIGDGSDFD